MSHAPTRFAFQELPDRGIATLRVSGTLDFEQRPDFVAKTEELLGSDQARLVLDLTRIEHIFSVYFGTIADASQRAAAAEKHLSVLVTEKLAKLFRQTSLDELLNIVVVDAPK